MSKNISLNDDAQRLLDNMAGGSYSSKISKLWTWAQQGSTMWELECERSFGEIIKMLKGEDAPKEIIQQIGFLSMLISDKRYFGSPTAQKVTKVLREAAVKKML